MAEDLTAFRNLLMDSLLDNPYDPEFSDEAVFDLCEDLFLSDPDELRKAVEVLEFASRGKALTMELYQQAQVLARKAGSGGTMALSPDEMRFAISHSEIFELVYNAIRNRATEAAETERGVSEKISNMRSANAVLADDYTFSSEEDDNE